MLLMSATVAAAVAFQESSLSWLECHSVPEMQLWRCFLADHHVPVSVLL